MSRSCCMGHALRIGKLSTWEWREEICKLPKACQRPEFCGEPKSCRRRVGDYLAMQRDLLQAKGQWDGDAPPLILQPQKTKARATKRASKR